MARITAELLIAQAYIYGIDVGTEMLPDGLLGKANAETKKITLNINIERKPRLYKSVLAEEIGHILYPPRPGHVRYHSADFWQYDNFGQTKITVAQDERAALDWATSILMPNVEMWRVLSEGFNTIPLLIDYFDVEDWLVRHKIGFIRRQARQRGEKLKWRDIIKRSI